MKVYYTVFVVVDDFSNESKSSIQVITRSNVTEKSKAKLCQSGR